MILKQERYNCVSSMTKERIGIFFSNHNKKFMAFRNMIDNIDVIFIEDLVKIIRCSKSQGIIETEKSIIRLIVVSDSSKGCRFDRIMIDNDIEYGVVTKIILPTCISGEVQYF